MVKEILQIKYGDTTIPENWIFKGGKEEVKVPIILSFFLIITENRKILVDTGSDTMDGFELKNFVKPVTALENSGFSPDSITDVIITHSHHDHIGCVGYYKNARVFIQEEEYESGKKYVSDNPQVTLFDDEITVCDEVRVVKIGGHTNGSSVVEAVLDGKVYVIAGDECYSSYNLKNKIPTASSANLQNSERFIKRYTSPQYKVLLIH